MTGQSVAALIDRYRHANARIATAESCTGGLLAGALTDPSGASDVFERGFVTYSNAAKVSLLGVQEATLMAHGAVSEPVAREMAEGALARSEADVVIAITGIAGPGASDNKPEGRVCFALATRGGDTFVETHDFGALGRSTVRAVSIEYALRLLANAPI